MCHYADAGDGLPATGYGLRTRGAYARVFACFIVATLVACGSTQSVPTAAHEEKSQVAASAAAPAKSSKPDKLAAAENASTTAPAEEPLPAEAVQQFDSAVALMSSGNATAAEQAFRSLSSSYPAYSGALLNLGILQARAGKLDDAEETIKSAIERNAYSAVAFNQLGIVYRRSGRFKEADEAYQRSLQIDPDYALAYLNLAVLCDLYLQQPQRALEAYERYLQLAATPDAKVKGWVTELKTRLGRQPRSANTGE
jgi:tetratricopeptide (TPR) repeat protein